MDNCKQNMQADVVAAMGDCNCMKNKKVSESQFRQAQDHMSEHHMCDHHMCDHHMAEDRMCEDHMKMENRMKMRPRCSRVESISNFGCSCIDDMPLAMAYVPYQELDSVYQIDEGFVRGTIFPELDLPFYGRSCD